MLHSEIAYLDPDTFGESGYSKIGPLLLFFHKLVVYGPVGALILKAYNNPRFHKTSLTLYEFTKYVEEGTIVPLGFHTFFDEDNRHDLYLPELGITTDFDTALLGGSLAERCIRVPNEFKYNESPLMAKHIIDSHKTIRNFLYSRLDDRPSLPKRYTEFHRHPYLIPRALKDVVGSYNVMPYLVIYDLLNNRHVMHYFEERHECVVVHAMGKYSSLGIGDRQKKEANRDLPELLGAILTECVAEIDYERLSKDKIDEFRRLYRAQFINFIRAELHKVESEPDPAKRKEVLMTNVQNQCRRMKWHMSIGVRGLIEIIPVLRSHAVHIEMMLTGPPGSARRRFYDKLRMPLRADDRWFYGLLVPHEVEMALPRESRAALKGRRVEDLGLRNFL